MQLIGNQFQIKAAATMDGSFLVTGAAQGFGREFTRRVLLAGGTVLLSDNNPEGGLATTKEFQEVSGTIDFVRSLSRNLARIGAPSMPPMCPARQTGRLSGAGEPSHGDPFNP